MDELAGRVGKPGLKCPLTLVCAIGTDVGCSGGVDWPKIDVCCPEFNAGCPKYCPGIAELL